MDKRTRLYAQLLDDSKERRETNVAEHKVRTGRIKRSLAARRKLREAKKEAKVPTVPLDFLAIGDSWFEYPLYNEVLSFQNNAIVANAARINGKPAAADSEPSAPRPGDDRDAVLGEPRQNDNRSAGPRPMAE